MPSFKYLIVGGGMTADAAVSGIREVDANGSIGLISAEVDPPYDRPPLTKGLWKNGSFDEIWRSAAKDHSELHLGRRVVSIDLKNKNVSDDLGTVYSYEKLLLATGGRPRRLLFEGDEVIYYRTAADYRRLRSLTEKGDSFVVIGGGFIGSEIAASLAMNKKQVTMLFPGAGICHKIFPRELSLFLNEYYRQKGVTLLLNEKVSNLEKRGSGMLTRTEGKREIGADGVIAGLGIELNTDFARRAGLQIEDGIVVDDFLCTSARDVFAAGDVASFYDHALGKRRRVEHEDNANTMGKIAGRNMAGQHQRYDHQPFFYSDLFDLGYEAVGELDSRLETFIDWKEVNREGVIYYLQEGRVRGVLLWNLWEQVDAARKLIAEQRTYSRRELKGALEKTAADLAHLSPA